MICLKSQFFSRHSFKNFPNPNTDLVKIILRLHQENQILPRTLGKWSNHSFLTKFQKLHEGPSDSSWAILMGFRLDHIKPELTRHCIYHVPSETPSTAQNSKIVASNHENMSLMPIYTNSYITGHLTHVKLTGFYKKTSQFDVC